MPKIAYIVSAFPTLTETFVLYDILAMEKLGVTVELYPLRRSYQRVVHSEAKPWIKRAHYSPFLSLSVLRSNLHFLRRSNRSYFKVLAETLRRTWGSANYFLGALAIFPMAVHFARQMEQQGIAHVHAHFANHPAVAGFIISRLTGIPFSFTARGTDVQVDRHMLKEKLEAAEFAIAVSAHNKAVMVSECGQIARDKVRVIYGGVDVNRLTPPARTQRRSDEPLRILCVARFEEVKGHAYLVDACRLLKRKGIPFRCDLIGDGPLQSVIGKQIESAGLLNEVKLLGARTYPEVIRELREADVVVLPTAPTAKGKREGIPNVLKEAMACGLPVVASSVGGIPELVEHKHSGILVLPRDPIGLAAALHELYVNPGLGSELGRAGRAKIVREFNLKVSTTKRAKLLLKSINGESDPSSFQSPEQSKSLVAAQYAACE